MPTEEALARGGVATWLGVGSEPGFRSRDFSKRLVLRLASGGGSGLGTWRDGDGRADGTRRGGDHRWATVTLGCGRVSVQGCGALETTAIEASSAWPGMARPGQAQ